MPAGPRFEQLTKEAKSRIKEISAQQAAEQQRLGALLIDVREVAEYEKEHATGAMHLSRGVLELKIEQAAPDPATPIICYCGGGSRSALAADSLQSMGYTNVASLIGGFKKWSEGGLPTET